MFEPLVEVSLRLMLLLLFEISVASRCNARGGDLVAGLCDRLNDSPFDVPSGPLGVIERGMALLAGIRDLWP